jgi:hypothetical protein
MAPERLAIEKVRGPNSNGGAAEQERTVRCRLVALHLTILNFAVVNLAVMNGRIAEIFCFDGCATWTAFSRTGDAWVLLPDAGCCALTMRLSHVAHPALLIVLSGWLRAASAAIVGATCTFKAEWRGK